VDEYGHVSRSVQRYRCEECERSFTLQRQKKRRYSWQLAVELTRRHVEERASYRVLAKRCREKYGVKINAMSVQRLVLEVAEECKTPAEMSKELGLDWRGFMIADDKHISIRGKYVVWYVCVDRGGDIFHVEVMPAQTVGGMVRFFEVVRDDLGYPMKGLTTDEESLFALAYRRVYPGKPHQICIKHVLDGVDRRIGYTPRQRDLERWKRVIRDVVRSLPDRSQEGSYDQGVDEVARGIKRIKELKLSLGPIERLRKSLRRIVLSKTYETALARWAAFHRHPDRGHTAHGVITETIGRKWRSLTVHFDHPGMPRTNNDAESVMRQLELRLKTIGSFGNVHNAQAYINLLVAYLRLKPYTDCRGSRKRRNGYSRLELAGAEIPKNDWIQMALKRRV
jgi:transposase-like protein